MSLSLLLIAIAHLGQRLFLLIRAVGWACSEHSGFLKKRAGWGAADRLKRMKINHEYRYTLLILTFACFFALRAILMDEQGSIIAYSSFSFDCATMLH
jgi:hypothetical protein